VYITTNEQLGHLRFEENSGECKITIFSHLSVMEKTSDLAPLLSKFSNLTVDSYGGSCPVQVEGFYEGKPYYFRLRHSWASLSLGGQDVVGEPEFFEELLIAPESEDIGFAESKDIINIFAKLLNLIKTKYNI
jgi:hypothetical protein